MKSHFAVLTAVFLSLAASSAEAAVGLELGIHEAARTARRHEVNRLLIVVREDSRSLRSVASADELTGLEQQVTQLLKQESGIRPVNSAEVREQARTATARRSMTPAQAQPYLKIAPARGVLNLDYRRSRTGYSARMTLLNARRILMTQQIELSEAPSLDEDSPLDDSPTTRADETESSKGEKKEEELKDGDSPAKTNDYSSLPPGVRPPTKAGPTALKITKRAQAGRVGVRATGTNRTTVRRTPIAVPAPGAATGQQTGGGRVGDGARTPDREAPRPEDRDRENSEGDTEGRRQERTEEDSDRPLPVDPRTMSQVARGIVNFAARNIGNKVGDGDCWDLAMEAMRAAGAEPPRGYTFGDEIPLNELRPGDILQFTSARFEEPGYYVTMGTPNHTAVVSSLGNRRAFILQQNFDGQRFVTTFDVDFNNMTRGSVQAFRPRPRQGLTIETDLRRRSR